MDCERGVHSANGRNPVEINRISTIRNPATLRNTGSWPGFSCALSCEFSQLPISMAEWLRAWDTMAMMKLWRREVVSSIPDRGTIVG